MAKWDADRWWWCVKFEATAWSCCKDSCVWGKAAAYEVKAPGDKLSTPDPEISQSKNMNNKQIIVEEENSLLIIYSKHIILWWTLCEPTKQSLELFQ